MDSTIEQTTNTQNNHQMNNEPTPKRRANPLFIAVLMLLPLLVVVLLGMALIEANQAQLNSGVAPDFTLTTYDGETFTLSEHRGKVVLINFWASWCVPCEAEADDLNAIYNEYKDRGLVMIGVGYNDTETNARRFMERFDMRYPAAHDRGDVSRDYRVRGVPETFIIDKNGVIRQAILSEVTAQRLRTLLDPLLAEQPAS
jgi:cytochrome c biogenesis protein CcmG, thiol:disulfide interchange protein DsbE